MKYFAAIIGLFLWLMITLVLAVSVVGWLVLADEEYFKIPGDLLKAFES